MADSDAFAKIVARDMVLQEEFQCIPPVLLDETSPQPPALFMPTAEAFAALAVRSHKLSYLDIRLDW